MSQMPVPWRLTYHLYQWFWSGMDWLYPPYCGGCGQRGGRWCPDCHQKAEVISQPICPRCGQAQKSSRLCPTCRTTPPRFQALRSWAAFNGPLRNALHRLKYRRDLALGEVLARPMIECLQGLHWPIEMIVPVPLGVARLAQRGYNQAALLARPLALSMGILYRPQAMYRVRETRSQVDLTVTERRENMTGAFRASGKFVNKRCILVIDDVATSGATLDACAGALLEAGASQVFGLTLARTVLK